MQNAETVLDVLRERGRRACRGRAVSAAVQPAAVSDGLRASVLQPGGDDARGRRGDRGRHVLAKIGRIIDALRHERYRFSRSSGSTSRRRTGRRGRWACRPGRTSWSAR